MPFYTAVIFHDHLITNYSLVVIINKNLLINLNPE